MLTARKLVGAGSAVMLLIFLGACGTDPPAPREQAQAGRVIAEGLFGNAAWTSEGIFAGMAGSADPVAGYDQVVEILDDGTTRRMDVRGRSGCRLNHVGGLNTSVGGQLVYTATCVGPEFAPEEDISDIRSLDPATGQDRSLVTGLSLLSLGLVSWDPDTSAGIVDVGDTRCAYLAKVSRDGVAPFPLLATVDGITWSNEPERQGPSVDGCASNADNRRPSLSPDGSLLASFGRPDGDDQPWALLLSPATGGRARVLVSGLTDPATAEWAPDGNHLAFAAQREGSLGRAVWLLELDTLRLELLVRDSNGIIAWSPDGRELLVGSDIGDVTFPQPMTLTIYEVG